MLHVTHIILIIFSLNLTSINNTLDVLMATFDVVCTLKT